MTFQPGIMSDIPKLARYQFFHLKPGANVQPCLDELAALAVSHAIVIGFGQSLLAALDVAIPGMHKMPEFEGKGIDMPSTPFALWCWVRGDDRGELLHKARLVRTTVQEAFVLSEVTDAFRYETGRDLSGYEDGTENPQGDDALEAAFLQTDQSGLADSSFVAVQRWVHDLDAFQAMPSDEQDNRIGRERISNEELDDAPESAHVKRTAQENFEPKAFLLRRSMPWANEKDEGLLFVAFGKSFNAFEAQMKRMLGVDDGIIDGLFGFTMPVTGSYFWCPPIKGEVLDLSALKT